MWAVDSDVWHVVWLRLWGEFEDEPALPLWLGLGHPVPRPAPSPGD